MIEHETRRMLVAVCVNDDDGDEENDLVCDGVMTQWTFLTNLNTTDRRDCANNDCVYHA